MTGLLVLYMVNQLLLPGHIEHIAGFVWHFARVSPVGDRTAEATRRWRRRVFGLYAPGFVYFTPVLGGIIADRWIGQRNAVVLGALAPMSGGHLAMSFERSFLLALLLLVIGSGLLKGNISTQVGALYPGQAMSSMRTRGYAIFSTAINFGAVVGPLLWRFSSRRPMAGTTGLASPPCSCWAASRPICMATATCRRAVRRRVRAQDPHR